MFNVLRLVPSVVEEDAWKHMTSLRTQYSRCMRIGTATATTPRQKWLVRELGFLRPYIKKRLRASTCPRAMVLPRNGIPTVAVLYPMEFHGENT